MPLANIFKRGSRKDAKSASPKPGPSERKGIKESVLENGEGLKISDSQPKENVKPVENEEEQKIIDSSSTSDQTDNKDELILFTDGELEVREKDATSNAESSVNKNVNLNICVGIKPEQKSSSAKSEEDSNVKLKSHSLEKSLNSESNTSGYSRDNSSTEQCEIEKVPILSSDSKSNVNEEIKVQQTSSEDRMQPVSVSSEQDNCSTGEEIVKSEEYICHQIEIARENVEEGKETSIAKEHVSFNEFRRNSEKEAFLQRIANAIELEDSSASVSEESKELSDTGLEKDKMVVLKEIVDQMISEILQGTKENSLNSDPLILEYKESLQQTAEEHLGKKIDVPSAIETHESYAQAGAYSEEIEPTEKEFCAVESTNNNAPLVIESHSELTTNKKTVTTPYADCHTEQALPVLHSDTESASAFTTEEESISTSLTNQESTASIKAIGHESTSTTTTETESATAHTTVKETPSVKRESDSAWSGDKVNVSRTITEKEPSSTLPTDAESSLVSTTKNESDPTTEKDSVSAPSTENKSTAESFKETKSVANEHKRVPELAEEHKTDDCLVSKNIPTDKSTQDNEKESHVKPDASVTTGTSSVCEEDEARKEKHEDEHSIQVTQVVNYLIEQIERSGNPEITVSENGTKPLSESDSSSALIDQDDIGDVSPQQDCFQKTDCLNWKVGYLQVKLPAKSRKTKLKAWQKRWVVIQLDEFTSDKSNNSVMLSIYHSESGNSRKHSAVFWKSISAKTAVVYRSVSKTHPYTFTIAEDNEPEIFLAAESESASQEWMAAIRAILWPPSSVMQLEKVLNGNEFEISIIDNDFSYRAGLLGTYGYMTVTTRKLILCHPQSGHVIQEWYLNTVDKFQVLPQQKEEDVNKVLLMLTSSDSSTGCGQIKFFCTEAVDLLKSIASTIHKVLQYHSKSNNICYSKELDELAGWLTPQSSPKTARSAENEDYYKVPPRQVRSLLDIPNFLFDMPLKTTTADNVTSSENLTTAAESPAAKLKPSTTCVSTFSQDSGISVAMSTDDFLNCSGTSFTIGNRSISGHVRSASTSESSDDYSPPSSPAIKARS